MPALTAGRISPDDFRTERSIATGDFVRKWGRPPGPLDRRRIRETARLVPPMVRTVLDAGCGSGWLSHALAGRFEVVALDCAEEALSHVRPPKVRGDVARPPFASRSFDIVCCCETIEHLDDRTYRSALGELARVSGKYILVTVPNSEELDRRYAKCPKCGVRFSPHGHVRSFTKESLLDLFVADGTDRAKCLAIVGIAPTKVYRQNRALEGLRPERLGFWSVGKGMACPRCSFRGYSPLLRPLWRLWTSGLRVLNGMLNPIPEKRSLWLLALYEVVK